MVIKMRTVNEVSKITGVSVRTLHHYDAIGLLKPAKVTGASYRLYDDMAISRLQSILLFRELQFSLKEIKEILDSPNYDPAQALDEQIRLLELQYRRMGELIDFARDIQKKGVKRMEFQMFDKSEIEQYKKEIKEKWGDTKAYHEFEEKEKSGMDFDKNTEKLMLIFSEIGALGHLSPADSKVQEKIHILQNFMTENYYTCTNEILEGLGQMYREDERFRQTIDRAGGDGTAEFVGKAILIYCNGKN